MKKLSDCNILIVDDTEMNIDILVGALGDDYELSVAMDGEAALEMMEIELPDLILLDIMMPGLSGYEVCEKLKKNPTAKEIPIIFLTAMTDIESKTKGFEAGAVDYITKPFEILEVKARVQTHLYITTAKKELALQNEILEQRVIERTEELCLTQEITIEALASLAEYRDPDTGGHIYRTKNYVKILAEKLSSFEKYKNILNENSFLKHAMEISKSHQEKWNGTGYPDGLSGDDIPIAGRIMAIADVYDALISKRIYKPPFTHRQAVAIIKEGRGIHFDPLMVDAFEDVNEEFRQIAIKYADCDEERVTLNQV